MLKLRWFLLVAIGCVLASSGVAQTSSDSVLGAAVDRGQEEAKKNLDPSNLQKNTSGGNGTMAETPEEFFQRVGFDSPILADRLETPMRRYAQKVIIGFWSFYTSSWWQITIKSLLLLTTFLGIQYHIHQITEGAANAGQAWRTILVKVSVAGLTIAILAPNTPFVLTRAINSMVNASTFSTGDADVVRYHQQAFLRRCLLMEARCAQVLDARLTNQFYNDSVPLVYRGNTPVPESIAPTVDIDGKDGVLKGRKVTPFSFLFAGPPMLGDLYHKDAKDGGKFLYAPVSNQLNPDAYVARTYGFYIKTLLKMDLKSDDLVYNGQLTVPDPFNSGQKLTVIKRPYGASVAAGLKLYQTLADKWPEYREKKVHRDMLEAVDKVALLIFDEATKTLVEDVLKNQTFAFTPSFNAVDPGFQAAFFKDPHNALRLVQPTTTSNGMNNTDPETAARVSEMQKSFRIFYQNVAASLAKDFNNIKKSQVNGATYDWVIPIGLLMCNAYIILAIWLLPVMLSLWAVLFILPPYFELSNALKKGAAVIVALAFYPVLLQLILVYCFALADAANALDSELDGERTYAKLAIYGMLPSTPITGGVSAGLEAAKVSTVSSLADMVNNTNAGIGTMIAWIMILLILVGSPAIVAKFIMGIGAADALAQPVQSGATMGGGIAARTLISGGANAAASTAAVVGSAASALSQRMPR